MTNGTVALQIALKAAGVGSGDEVIVPPYTFVATASAVLDCNAVPIFADIESDSLCLDPSAVADKVTDRTAAVIPVHLGGRPADLNALTDICDQYDLTLIEDCAQAHGSWFDNEAVGTIGDAGCFSFQSTKNLSSGEGGIIVTNDDDEIYRNAWSIANVGRHPEGEWYEHPVHGSNHRMTEFQAAILRQQLTRLNRQLEVRKAAADKLNERVDEIKGMEVQSEHPKTTQRAYHLYILRIDRDTLGGIEKTHFVDAVSAEGVPIAEGYNPLYREGIFRHIDETAPAVCELSDQNLDYSNVECPATERAAEEVCWLPQRVLLEGEEGVKDITQVFEKVVEATHQLGD